MGKAELAQQHTGSKTPRWLGAGLQRYRPIGLNMLQDLIVVRFGIMMVGIVLVHATVYCLRCGIHGLNVNVSVKCK